MSKKQQIGLVSSVIVALTVGLLLPISGLSDAGRITLGLFLGAIVLWILEVFPFVVTCFLLLILLVVAKVAKFDTAFSGLTQTTWWLMLGAMGFSVALNKTGVLKRFAYHILQAFPPGYMGQVLAVAAAGFAITPMIPSVNVKIAMLMPMVKTISDTVGYKPFSKGAHGLWSAAYVSLVLGSYGFATANLFSIIVSGILPAEGKIGWFQWFVGAIPWLLIAGVGTLVASIIMFNPKDEAGVLSKEFIRKQLESMGPMSKEEKACLAILIGAVVLWVFESQIGIPSQVTSLIAMTLVLAFRIINIPEFKNGVPWDMLLMIGTMMGIGPIFQEVGINDFIYKSMSPVISLITGNALVFLLAYSLLIASVRMVITNVITLFMVLIPLFIPFAQSLGINPWILGFVTLVSQTHWGLLYMSNFGIPAYGMWGGQEMLRWNELAKPSWVFCMLNLVAIGASIPFWKLIGLIK